MMPTGGDGIQKIKVFSLAFPFQMSLPADGSPASREGPARTWMCLICGWIYDEAAGLPDEGIAPGTRWEDVPPNWTCPECGARKEDFEMVEI